MKHLVAVYGTLKRGPRNSHLMKRARYVGTDALASLTLYDLGPYPGARLRPSSGVTVEIYAVDDRTLAELDVLEGYRASARGASLYRRRKIATCFGMTWVYLYNQRVRHGQRIANGTW